MTAPPEDGSGAQVAMNRALDSAGLSPQDIHHINAHGTGTKVNDAAEATAIRAVFDERIPVMSCKGLTGHSLGGSGAIEVVASVISIKKRRAYQNVGVETPGPDCPVSLVPSSSIDLPKKPVILSNSFGFGGNNCSLIIGAHGGKS